MSFQRLSDDDLDAVHRLHGDPATNVHNPYGASPDEAASAATLADWVEHWRRRGYGYELAFARDELAGIEGGRRDVWRGMPVVNLYWRLLPSFQGTGLSVALAQRALQLATSAETTDLIVARMLPANVASMRVAQRLGLHRRPDLDDVHDGFAWVIYAHRPDPCSSSA
ncbi:GNAT family N-acetyltransferase [Microbacterium sp. P02]|uniref:GNAT family N-acetyltransferase n=1 Tax=Microbacterium sp. P02 TaxID=3366260 RepID=UPI00366E0B9C